MKKKAHEAHKEACDQEREHLTDPLAAKAHTRSLMLKWGAEQEEIRKAEEARLQVLARKAEEEAQLAAALAAEAAGHTEKAQEIIEEEVYVPPVILQKTTPKIQGVRFQTVWKFRYLDEMKIPRKYLIPDEVKIGATIRAWKREGEVIPGIEAYWEKI